MAIGSGLAGSFGIAPETTYGTYVAPTRFLEVNKVDLKKVKNVKQGGGLAAGRLLQRGTRRVVTTRAASGGVELEVPNKGFGLLLQALMGTTVTPVQQATTTAYLQTHTIADNVGKMLTAQVGVPDLAGTVRPYTYTGCKVMGAEFSCGVDDLLMAKVDMDARDVSESQGLVAPSYPAGLLPRSFPEMGFKWGTFGSEAAVQGVRKVTVKIERPQAGNRFYANNLGLKSEPLMNNWLKISGSIETDYIDKTIFADRYAADSSASMILEFVGPLIASTFFETFRIRIPMVFLDGDTPTLDSPDVVNPTFSFTAEDDGTNSPVTIEYMSTDVTT